MKTNYHTHTSRCQHATGSDEEYVISAIKGGYQELGFSDHSPWKYKTDYVSDIRMIPEEFPEYVESIRFLQYKYRDKIKISLGLECEYFPEYMQWVQELAKEYRLDFILFGNHHFHTDEEFLYFGRYTTTPEMLELYQESSIEGMESGLYSYMAHPDLFMRSYPEFDEHCHIISRHICHSAARLGIPLEYNIGMMDYAQAFGKTTYPHPEFWQIAADEGCIAILGVDAHEPRTLEYGGYYEQARRQLKELKIKTTDKIEFLEHPVMHLMHRF